jgi:sugar phosphate isomerase/epimerase
MFTRRQLLTHSMGVFLAGLNWPRARGADAGLRKFTIDLRCGSIGVHADQRTAIRLAAKYGFESVNPEPSDLAKLSPSERTELVEELREKRLAWGAAGLPIDFRRDENAFRAGLENLPRLAEAMQQTGVTRVGTWLSPSHDELTYVANFRQHARRLRHCASILKDHGQRLGLEYVGPKTSWASKRHPFVHSMSETKELITEIGLDNVGIVLDSWHWYTAHETVADLRSLTNRDVVACDLNDAPRGLQIDQQLDSNRELPAATGVIDLKAFLTELLAIGYDGPVRAEPFNAALNQMDDEAAVSATAEAMNKALMLLSAA